MVQETQRRRRLTAYQRWMESRDLPVYRGHFVAEARITEIPPGQTSEPLKLALSEVVYVLDGQGLTTVWAGDGPKKSFEWQKSSLFCLPRHCWYTFSNTRGDRPARLLN